jgi:hypothetical protein
MLERLLRRERRRRRIAVQHRDFTASARQRHRRAQTGYARAKDKNAFAHAPIWTSRRRRGNRAATSGAGAVREKLPAEIVNLRKARKARARDAATAAADANRAAHGQPKAVKSLAEARRRKAARDLDGHRRQDDGSASES